MKHDSSAVEVEGEYQLLCVRVPTIIAGALYLGRENGRRVPRSVAITRLVLEHMKDECDSLIQMVAGGDPSRLAAVHAALAYASGKPGGFVYLMRSGNRHKIGSTKHLAIRKKQLEKEYRCTLKIVHSIMVPDRLASERLAHSMFRDKHLAGDWFGLGRDEVRLFRGMTATDLSGS